MKNVAFPMNNVLFTMRSVAFALKMQGTKNEKRI